MTLVSFNSFGQGNQIRQSQKSTVTQYVGADTQITINYSRPAVKGRVVWGNMVPYGLAEPDKYSDGKSFPWRAGANENTTIELNNEVKIGGKTLPKGKYSIHMIPSESDWIVIFNKNNNQWGSFSYDESADALTESSVEIAESIEASADSLDEASEETEVENLASKDASADTLDDASVEISTD